MVGSVPVLILDFVILAKVSFVLFQLSECDTTLEKKSVLSCKCNEDEPLKTYLS